MSKTFPMFIAGALVLGLVAIWLAIPPATSAQCGSIESSCFKCHQEAHPVCGTTEWHSEYGHRYACWNCHGGNDTAQDKELAHVGLVRHPLEDVYTSCYACHPENYKQLAERFAKTLGVTVSYHEPFPRSITALAPIEIRTAVTSSTETPAIPTNSFEPVWILWLSPLPLVVALAWLKWKRRTP
jgi:hypothetical protein